MEERKLVSGTDWKISTNLQGCQFYEASPMLDGLCRDRAAQVTHAPVNSSSKSAVFEWNHSSCLTLPSLAWVNRNRLVGEITEPGCLSNGL